jgi:hypothetical protein
MCDYSLQGLPNRLAETGEQLVTHRFPTGSIGLASPIEIANPPCKPKRIPDGRSWWARFKQWMAESPVPPGPPAVCIAPGTCLRMTHIPESLRKDYGLAAAEKVTFVQFSAEPFQYRDGIQFSNGRRTLLQNLREGVEVQVLELVREEPVQEEETKVRTSLRLVWPAEDLTPAGRM